MPRGGLGTGLSAIFGEEFDVSADSDYVLLPISKVEANAEQARKHFDEIALNELADSIREHGIIQPITVRKLDTGYYQIIAGERRWRAARQAGLSEVPCRIFTADAQKSAEISLIENLQREDLNPLEEAEGYRVLTEAFGLTQDEAAARVGKARSTVTNALRLLPLGKEIKAFLEQGMLSAGHARALLRVKNQDLQLSLAQKIIKEGLSVRQAEELTAKKWEPDKQKVEREAPFVDYTREAETQLTKSMGRRVKIQTGKKNGKGKVEIEFYNDDDLNALIQALGALGSWED